MKTHNPTDREAWRPQVPRSLRRTPSVVDPVIEPLWEGIHVLVHASGGAIRLIVEGESDISDEHPSLVQALREAMAPGELVLDGWITDQASRTGRGLTLLQAEVPRGGLFFPRTMPPPREIPHDRPGTLAFVAVDLLVLDGEPLFDIPLLERKRLLESVVTGSELVRVSPLVRPPLDRWMASWRAVGFQGAVLKAANSRYVPGHETEEWSVALPRRRP